MTDVKQLASKAKSTITKLSSANQGLEKRAADAEAKIAELEKRAADAESRSSSLASTTADKLAQLGLISVADHPQFVEKLASADAVHNLLQNIGQQLAEARRSAEQPVNLGRPTAKVAAEDDESADSAYSRRLREAAQRA